jgi:hypothetical protein
MWSAVSIVGGEAQSVWLLRYGLDGRRIGDRLEIWRLA